MMFERIPKVGWFLQTSEAKFIWADPLAVHNKPTGGAGKSVSYCPAVGGYDSRLYQIPCPFDLRLRVALRGKDEAPMISSVAEGTSLNSRAEGNILDVAPRSEWRDPCKPILQLRSPYTFVSDAPVWMSQLPPILDYRKQRWPGVMFGGRFPIHIWPRVLSWAFEWHSLDEDLVLNRGQPWFYVQFETLNPGGGGVRLVRARLTDDLREYIAGVSGTASYVRGTFSLFETAIRRRPKRLLHEQEVD